MSTIPNTGNHLNCTARARRHNPVTTKLLKVDATAPRA